MATVNHTAEQIATAWSAWSGKMSTFARMLDAEGIGYLSFSKVSSVTFCSQRYLLEYVERRKLSPEPTYFVKGRLLHEAAAKLHRAHRRGRRMSLDQAMKTVRRRLGAADAEHIRNALVLMDQQRDDGREIVAVEEPFVLDLGDELPPLLGIVDLVLRRGDEFMVIDHKGVRRFGDSDRLQLVLYRQYVLRQYNADECMACFDQYRWVNDLDRIRKPASQRTEVKTREGGWNSALRRIGRTHRSMQKIERTGAASADGDCIVCPYRSQCPEARIDFGGSWY